MSLGFAAFFSVLKKHILKSGNGYVVFGIVE